jgi:hypothetical protein
MSAPVSVQLGRILFLKLGNCFGLSLNSISASVHRSYHSFYLIPLVHLSINS